MIYIAHRINKSEELKDIPFNIGVELDLRDRGERLILNHDPFGDVEDFEEYLKNYHHGLMILNIKSERIEHRVIELIKKYTIKDYFFLDSTFPMIHLLSNMGEKNIALRFSEYEGLDTLKNMQSKVNWVWVDCFTKLPIDNKIYKEIKSMGYKLCLVSPELQSRPEDIEKMKTQIDKEEIIFDAVCSKIYNYDKWIK